MVTESHYIMFVKFRLGLQVQDKRLGQNLQKGALILSIVFFQNKKNL